MTGDRRFETAHLDELESVPGPGTLTWHPVRARFDIRAFGANAYSAEKAGDHVVEPHDEEGEDGEQGHQELYFVASGSAEFTIDEDHFEAPSGTYVWLPDPSTRREAVAKEPGTTVLSFGGPPTFKPSAWEFRWRALREAGADSEGATRIIDEGLAVHPGDTGLRLARAEIALAAGDRYLALTTIAKAVAEDSDATVWVGEEGAFPGLRSDPETAAAAGLDPEG